MFTTLQRYRIQSRRVEAMIELSRIYPYSLKPLLEAYIVERFSYLEKWTARMNSILPMLVVDSQPHPLSSMKTLYMLQGGMTVSMRGNPFSGTEQASLLLCNIWIYWKWHCNIKRSSKFHDQAIFANYNDSERSANHLWRISLTALLQYISLNFSTPLHSYFRLHHRLRCIPTLCTKHLYDLWQRKTVAKKTMAFSRYFSIAESE